MDLKLKDVAKLLNVSTTTVRRWLEKHRLPAYTLNHQKRFNRHEVEKWLFQHQRAEDQRAEERAEKHPTSDTGVALPADAKPFSLYRALHKGGVVGTIPGENKEEVIRATMRLIAQQLYLDAEVLTELLLDRERMMPTALNNGIGVPHTRDFLLSGTQDVVSIAFPSQAIDYGALDQQPVHTLFFLFASDDKRHLHLLAKIAHFTNRPETLAFLRTRPSADKLIAYVKEWETQLHKMEEG